MAESEWQEYRDQDKILVELVATASRRKLRLFCCACVRRVWYGIAEAESSRYVVAVAEEFADGHRTEPELLASAFEADRSISEALKMNDRNALRAAAWCGHKEMDALSVARSVAWACAYANQDDLNVERVRDHGPNRGRPRLGG